MSEIPLSSGDVAETAGGVKSGSFIDKTTFARGSSKVLMEGLQCVHLSASTLHYGASGNTGGLQAAPSQERLFVGQ